MRTYLEILHDIRNLFEYDLDTKGKELLEEYRHTQVIVQSFSIMERIKPYLSLDASSLVLLGLSKTQEEATLLLQDGYHLYSFGFTVERLSYEYEDLQKPERMVREEEYKTFAEYLNRAVDDGLLSGGLYWQPSSMPLAIISPSYRTMLFLYFFSKQNYASLMGKSNLFLREGELPYLLKDIRYE